MRNVSKSGEVNNSILSAPIISLTKLTKRQLIELFTGRVAAPLSPESLYHCAACLIGKWCNDVVSGRYASMYELSRNLEALENIYKSGNDGKSGR